MTYQNIKKISTNITQLEVYLMLPTHENIKQDNSNKSMGERG